MNWSIYQQATEEENEQKPVLDNEQATSKQRAANDVQEGKKRKTTTLFDRFWLVFPRKANKQAAVKAWKKIEPDEVLVAQMLTALSWQRDQAEWKKDSGKYIPHASTWLNNRRWEDEAPAATASATIPRRLQVAL